MLFGKLTGVIGFTVVKSRVMVPHEEALHWTVVDS
jgi:hypothetical protein